MILLVAVALLVGLLVSFLFTTTEGTPSFPGVRVGLGGLEVPLLEDLERAKDSVDPSTLFSAAGNLNLWDIYPPSANCHDLVRLGTMGDGGKWVCGLVDSKYQKTLSSPCIVYSFGISNDASFELGMLQQTHLNCSIYAFDPSIGQLPPDARPYVNKGKIRFRKLALGAGDFGFGGSISQSDHLIFGHLYDVMREFGHSHVDFLKIDIEGKEWDVMEELFERLEVATSISSIATLPFRQLMIELHYKDSLERVERFFSGMRKAGFVPVSREINLQPCSVGKAPFAAEYTFVNTRFSFEGAKATLLAPLPPPAKIQTEISPSLLEQQQPLAQRYEVGSGRDEGFFSQPLSQPHPNQMQSLNSVKACVYLLTQRSRVASLLRALQSLQENFLSDFPQYPVVIFHDDLTKRDITNIKLHASIRPKSLIFYTVKFSVPVSWASRAKTIPNRTECTPDISTMGYRHMCRFHATQVHAALSEIPQTKNVEYIWRLDDDSILTAQVSYDVFLLMKRNRKLYGFVSDLFDDPLCVKGLWNATRDFLASRHLSGGSQSLNTNMSFFHLLPERYTFYNNFEISAMSLWHSPLWKSYIDYIDDIGGIFTLRWGDAPIHTIGASLVLSLSQLHRFTDLGYTHLPFVKNEAAGLPPPSVNPLIQPESYNCQYFEKWNCNFTAAVAGLSSTKPIRYAMLSLPRKPAWVDIASTQLQGASASLSSGHSTSTLTLAERWGLPSKYGRFKTKTSVAASTNAAAATMLARERPIDSLESNQNRLAGAEGSNDARNNRIALFTFAGGSEHILAATMKSFYSKFVKLARTNKVPVSFVIFYSNRGAFKMGLLREALEARSAGKGLLANSNALSKAIAVPVTIRMPTAQQIEAEARSRANNSSDPESRACIPVAGELRGATMFLRRSAAAALAKMGFYWMFRFGLDSALHQPLAPTLFQSLESSGVRYAYVGQVLDSSRCAVALWEIATRFCADLEYGAASGLVSSKSVKAKASPLPLTCSPAFYDWPKHIIFFTNFEISEVALWQSPLCQVFMNRVEQDPRHEEYGDAAMHTLCALIVLPKSQLRRLTEVVYEASMPITSTGGSEDADVTMTAAAASTAAATTNSKKGTYPNAAMPKYQLTSLSELDKLFEPQRLGWLGGDVAASVYLPSPVEHNGYNAAGASQTKHAERYVWLFGDSLVGTSSASVRLEGEMVSNTVGIATILSTPRSVLGQKTGISSTDTLNTKFSSGTAGGGGNDSSTDIANANKDLTVRFHWGLTSAGGPRAVFELNDNAWLGNRPVEHLSFWPISGLAVTTKSNVELLVLGPVIRPTLDALGFQELATALFVVANPHDQPADWRYRSRVLDNTGEGAHFKWVALCQEQGERFARWRGPSESDGEGKGKGKGKGEGEDDWILLFGIYSPKGFQQSSWDLFGVQSRNEYQVLGRVRAGAAARLELDGLDSQLQVMCNGGHWQPANRISTPGNTSSACVPLALFRPSVSEMSVSRSAAGWKIVSLRMMENQVKVCRAAPEGLPTSFDCDFSMSLPSPWDSKEYNTYASKDHPELNTKGGDGFVMSIVSNPSKGPGELFGQPKHRAAYTPKFFYVTKTKDLKKRTTP